MAKLRKVQMQTARTFGGRISVMKEEGGGPWAQEAPWKDFTGQRDQWVTWEETGMRAHPPPSLMSGQARSCGCVGRCPVHACSCRGVCTRVCVCAHAHTHACVHENVVFQLGAFSHGLLEILL